jgi:hypothetical protein
VSQSAAGAGNPIVIASAPRKEAAAAAAFLLKL